MTQQSLSSNNQTKMTVENVSVNENATDETNDTNEPKEEDLSGDGGVLKKIITTGNGWEKPNTGDRVEVHYTGRLEDGTIFDSSVERGDKFSFNVGKGEVIKGWDIGVKSMKRGQKAIFTLAPEYGYGEAGSPPKIPPNSKLIFEIELFDWRREDVTKKKDGGVLKSIITEGSGYQFPNDGATVNVHLKVMFEGRVLEEKDATFICGEASESGIVDGVEMAVLRMKAGEKSLVIIRREYAWGDLPPRSFNLPDEYIQVEYEITLTDFEKRKETWEMSEDERIEAADYCKNRGSEFFKQNKFKLAERQYKRVTQYVGPYIASDNRNEKKDSLLLAGYLNLAAVYLKLNKPLDVLTNCNLALEMDPNNVKAIFRQGCANFAIKEYETAKSDFEKVLNLDANNKAAKVELSKVFTAIKAHHQTEKKLYANMFDIFARRDNEREQRRAGDVWNELKDEKKREFQASNEATTN